MQVQDKLWSRDLKKGIIKNLCFVIEFVLAVTELNQQHDSAKKRHQFSSTRKDSSGEFL